MLQETDPLVGIFLGRDIEWQRDAACAGTDVETFYPDKGESPQPAKRICRTCEVRAECLEYALELGERFGVWGMATERERRRLSKLLSEDAA